MNIENFNLSSDQILQTMDNCTKCGICHAYCPVANVTNKFPGPKYMGPQTQRFREVENLDELSADLCNGCGICMSVCPNDVYITDIITIAKSNIKNPKKIITFVQKILNRPDIVGKIGNIFPILSNFLLNNSFLRFLGEKFIGLSKDAPLPNFSGHKFKKYIKHNNDKKFNKNLIYFSGCSVDNFDSDVGISVIKIMNFLEYNVIVKDNLCCSLPMLSSGEWDSALNRSKDLIKSLNDGLNKSNFIISTSTSCSLTIKKKYAAYLNFNDNISNKVSNSIYDIFEYLLNNHINEISEKMNPIKKNIFYHGPCQLRNHGMGFPALDILNKIPSLNIILSKSECCGIGGTFGYNKDNANISNSISKSLIEQINTNKPDLILCDSETCRWNIEKKSGIKTIHPIQLINKSLKI